jgi:retron-type reverse transcriptase
VKRYGNLWPNVISFEALLHASEQAKKGKRFRPAVAAFEFHRERELWRLHEELRQKTYRPGAYRTFWIHEPKKRQISAAPYRDRVVHHALVNVLEPIFEKTFVFDSYACRTGKGTHAAVRRAQTFLKRFRYVLKADVRKFFPSIDHDILKERLARKVKDRDVLWLAGQIIDGSNPQEEVLDYFPGDDLFTPHERHRGLPIGNQTSQFFANVYLDPLDHFVKDRLGMAGYIRYVDDFLVFADDKKQLAAIRDRVEQFLCGLRLKLHPTKQVISRSADGIRFLGYRVFPTHRLLPKENVRRFRRRVRALQAGYAAGRLDWPAIVPRLMSWVGHARQANTHGLLERLFGSMSFRRAATS